MEGLRIKPDDIEGLKGETAEGKKEEDPKMTQTEKAEQPKASVVLGRGGMASMRGPEVESKEESPSEEEK